MKFLAPIATAAALMLAASAPGYAMPIEVCQQTQLPTAGSLPPQCALDETKQKHPSWYRDGGYCDTGSTLPDIGIQSEDCIIPT